MTSNPATPKPAQHPPIPTNCPEFVSDGAGNWCFLLPDGSSHFVARATGPMRRLIAIVAAVAWWELSGGFFEDKRAGQQCLVCLKNRDEWWDWK